MFEMQAMPWPFEPGRSPESSEAIVEPGPHLFQDSFRDRKEPSRPSMIVSNSQEDTLIYVHAGSNDSLLFISVRQFGFSLLWRARARARMCAYV